MTKKKYYKKELEDLYINQNKTASEIAKIYNTNLNNIKVALSRNGIKRIGNLEKNLYSDSEIEILKQIQKKNLQPEEVKRVLDNLKIANPLKYKPVKIDFPDKKLKFLAFSDSHIGHICYRPDVMDKMIKDAKRQGCEFAVNSGDTLEGMSGREGHIYELTHLGFTAQRNYFAKEFKKFDLIKDFKVYSIEAQDSHSGWYKNKGNMGLDIGEELQKANSHYNFIGFDEQDLKLDNGLKIRLRHPGGGTAYAISYKMQKYVEAISGGQKPNLVFQGHFHKANYIFYRNIHCYDAGTLANQTPFMKKKGTPAHIGYWIVEVNLNKNKDKLVERVTNQFVPFFE